MGRSSLALHRLSAVDRGLLRDMGRRLQTLRTAAADDGGVVPRWLGDALHNVLGLDLFCAYRPARRLGGTWGLGERVSVSPEGFFERYESAMARLPVPFLYDPLRPQRDQRNRVRLRSDICAHGPETTCVVEEFWPRLGIGSYDQIRVLVSRGSMLLAWVGGLREAPFGPRERDFLEALAPALRRSLGLRRTLVDADLVRAGLDGALGLLTAPAFVVRSNGSVEYANAAGTSVLDRSKTEVLDRLRLAITGSEGGCDVARLSSDGHRDVFLVVLRDEGAEFEQRLAYVAHMWGATTRETDVLRWVVLGDSNKEIALRLRCHEGNIERHVTSLLRKARCDGRSRMVARFWMAT
jgi:DNA-binding CsgD family transcriptional regulator